MKKTVDDKKLTVAFEDDLIAKTAESQLTTIQDYLHDADSIDEVVIDLKDVKSIDSMGINLLVGAFKQCKMKNLRFQVTGCNDSIRRLFQVYNLTGYFNIA